LTDREYDERGQDIYVRMFDLDPGTILLLMRKIPRSVNTDRKASGTKHGHRIILF